MPACIQKELVHLVTTAGLKLFREAVDSLNVSQLSSCPAAITNLLQASTGSALPKRHRLMYASGAVKFALEPQGIVLVEHQYTCHVRVCNAGSDAPPQAHTGVPDGYSRAAVGQRGSCSSDSYQLSGCLAAVTLLLSASMGIHTA